MKYYTFRRSSNDFKDILTDNAIKKQIRTKILWFNHLLIGLDDDNENLFGYIVLKYGDDIAPIVEKDYTPVIYKEYYPER